MSAPAVRASASSILLIEDEPAVMSYVRTTLERHGYEVVCSSSAAEGLKQLESQAFMGVVSDMRTPGGADGADVYAWLVANRPELTSRLVFITGDIANQETSATLRRTGVPWVEKPFRVQTFIAVVERIIGRP